MKTEKLELKHLVGYLPYGLEMQHKYIKAKHRGEDKLRPWISNLEPLSLQVISKSFEWLPILHPLSDLRNDTYDFIYNTECDYSSIENWMRFDVETRLSWRFSYEFWRLLCQHHFDIYGLIEKGLAIDINTL